MTSEAEELGVALAVLRAEERWSQKRLAAAAGMSSSYLSELESGKARLPRALAERLVALMGLPVASLDRALRYGRSHRHEVESYRLGGALGTEGQADFRAAAEEAVELWRGFALALEERVLGRFEVAAARRRAPGQWARLQSRSPSARRALIEKLPEFQNFALCEVICEQSVEAAARHPDEALELADLALWAAEHVPGDPAFRSRLRGYCWAFIGNARRLRDLWVADEAFRKFDELWAAGESAAKILSEARVLSLKASLRREQGRLQECAVLLERAQSVSQGGTELAGILINRAKLLTLDAEYEKAIEILQQATRHLDPRLQSTLSFVQRFNLVSCLVYAEHYALASEEFPALKALVARRGNSSEELRLRWMEGHIAAGLGRIDEGIALLEKVRAKYQELERPLDAALIALEMAFFRARQGRSNEVKLLAQQVMPHLLSQQVPRPALAVLNLFCEAASQEALTEQLARKLVEQLRGVPCEKRVEPDARSRPDSKKVTIT